MKVTGLYISPGHNFFGHFGKKPSKHPTLEVPEVECVAGQGLRGDRFFGFKEDYKGQITFFDFEVYEALCRSFEIWNKPCSVFRRNVITHGVDLNTLIGREFELQNIRFKGIAECAPCLWMNEAFCPGAEEFLKGRGGLRAKILSNGLLRST